MPRPGNPGADGQRVFTGVSLDRIRSPRPHRREGASLRSWVGCFAVGDNALRSCPARETRAQTGSGPSPAFRFIEPTPPRPRRREGASLTLVGGCFAVGENALRSCAAREARAQTGSGSSPAFRLIEPTPPALAAASTRKG